MNEVVVQVICSSPNLVEVIFAPHENTSSQVRGVKLFVNGLPVSFFTENGQVPVKASSDGSLLASVIVSESVKATDQVFIKMDLPRVSLTRVPLAFLGISTTAHHSPDLISPLSDTPNHRGILQDRTVNSVGLLSGWPAPITCFNSHGTRGNPVAPEYSRILLDNTDSSLTKEILSEGNPGRYGELLNFSVKYRAPVGDLAAIGLHLEASDGSISSTYADAVGSGLNAPWATLEILPRTLEALGKVSVGLYAASSAIPHTQNNSASVEVHFKDVLVTSSWRGPILSESLATPTSWISSGVAVPGADTPTGSQAYASWLDALPYGEANHALVLITENVLSVVSK